ncbi:hypothetical protein D3C74_424180 [compost metagenome]
MPCNQKCNNLIPDIFVIQRFACLRVLAAKHVREQIICTFLRLRFTLCNDVIY